jgi:hypothetical protein
MKKKNLIDDFTTFEIINKEGIFGGKRAIISSSTLVAGTYTNGSGHTFMDIDYGGNTRCDEADSK